MNATVASSAIAVACLNAIPALLGGWRWYRGQESHAFWLALRVGQVGALAYVIGIGVLAAYGRFSSEKLFYLYALLPVVVAFIAEQLRVTAAQVILDRRGLDGASAVAELAESEQHELVGAIVRREMAVMCLSALVVVFLTLRAAATAHGF